MTDRDALVETITRGYSPRSPVRPGTSVSPASATVWFTRRTRFARCSPPEQPASPSTERAPMSRPISPGSSTTRCSGPMPPLATSTGCAPRRGNTGLPRCASTPRGRSELPAR